VALLKPGIFSKSPQDDLAGTSKLMIGPQIKWFSTMRMMPCAPFGGKDIQAGIGRAGGPNWPAFTDWIIDGCWVTLDQGGF
jgi:hypothetical protein